MQLAYIQQHAAAAVTELAATRVLLCCSMMQGRLERAGGSCLAVHAAEVTCDAIYLLFKVLRPFAHAIGHLLSHLLTQLFVILAGSTEAATLRAPARLSAVQPGGGLLQTGWPRGRHQAARATQQPAMPRPAQPMSPVLPSQQQQQPAYDGGRPFPELRTFSTVVELHRLYDQGDPLLRQPPLRDLEHEQHSNCRTGWRQRWHELKAAAQKIEKLAVQQRQPGPGCRRNATARSVAMELEAQRQMSGKDGRARPLPAFIKNFIKG
jgi:hypothetical protein